MGDAISAAALGELALVVGREAAALLLDGWRDVRPVATKSSQHDLVTQMDQASERLVRERLAAVRPDDVVLGEEEGGADLPVVGDQVRWIVDPLDGTVNYFYGQRAWAVSIAAERSGSVVAGAVVAPAMGEEYLGVAGSGAWSVSGDRRDHLRVSSVAAPQDALVATGFGYRPERRACQGAVVARLLPEVRDIRRLGAASVDLCWTARGRFDAYFEQGLHYWDWAAGALIAAEAGARVGDLTGAAVSQQMTVAAPPDLFEPLVAVLRRLGAGQCP